MFGRVFIVLFLALTLFGFELQKPKIYHGDENITGWVMSEKLDGIRGYWNGKEFRTRQDKPIITPAEFTYNFPPFALDGELWVGRGKFEETQNIVMDKTPSEKWRKVTYNIFEVPNQDGNFSVRLDVAKNWFASNPNPQVRTIEQIPCKNKKQLEIFLAEIIKAGGEGIVVKNPLSPYQTGRSSDALKVKKFEDMEGEVVAINKKTDGTLSSLTLKLQNKIVFKLGSGFNRETSSNPPKTGDIVTFKYYSFTAKGKPRFAVFMRVRRD